MAYILGLFEDNEDALSAIDGFVDAGFTKDEISVLSKRHLTAEHDRIIHQKRGEDLGGFAGLLAGGYMGMFAGLALVTLPGIGLGLATGAFAVVLGLTGGGAVGATAGAIIGSKLVPSLMSGFDVSEDDAHFYAEAIRRDGVLVAVDTDPAREAEVREIMREKNAVNIEERRQTWQSEGWERFDDTDTIEPAPPSENGAASN
ncbi:MAG: hypothetical protein KDI79_24145 [Anaerolineae bacterium]|nr:hypothetical protein [Anaerolineae bacterium]